MSSVVGEGWSSPWVADAAVLARACSPVSSRSGVKYLARIRWGTTLGRPETLQCGAVGASSNFVLAASPNIERPKDVIPYGSFGLSVLW